MVSFEHCPFCAAAVEVTHYPGGFLVIGCPACSATWEAHGGLLRRIADGEALTEAEQGRPPAPPARPSRRLTRS